MRNARVLIVEDEPSLADLLQRTLAVAGFEVRTAGSCRQSRAVTADLRPELALLDVMLPDGSGLDLSHALRADHPDLAVVFVTAKDSLQDRLTDLHLGGDDDITKPFDVAARSNAVLRRTAGGPAARRWAVADLEMDEDAHRVVRAGRPLELSPTEYRLLRHLLDNAGRVLSKQQLLTAVWGCDFAADPGVVEKFVSRLRGKLGDPSLLHTVRGFGYVLRAPGT